MNLSGLNKLLIKYACLFILFSISDNFGQDAEIKQLFPGKWKLDNSNVYEEWDIVNDTEFVGKSYSMENGVKKINEVLYLKKFDDRWAYVAIPKNQIMTLFPLVESNPKKFIFENKEHDFPQRIIYEFHKGGELTAAIEGEVNGKFKRVEFLFKLVEE